MYRQTAQPTKQIALPTFTPVCHGILQRQCACGNHTTAGGECESCKQKRLQRAATNAAPVNGVPPIVHEALRSPGQPLDAETRAFMEPRFGHDFSGVRLTGSQVSRTGLTIGPPNDRFEREADQVAKSVMRDTPSTLYELGTTATNDFSQVRIHTDSKAIESARAVQARAYTAGNHLVFGEEQYAPSTDAGKLLLAHELTHTLQQKQSTIPLGHQVIQRAVKCDEFGACMSVPDPANIASLLPPGDCTPAEHRALQNEVDRACKGKQRRCLGTDNCASIWEKIEANAECIRARSVINSRCFRGGDLGHMEAVLAAVGALSNCWAMYNRSCQTPPVPVPEPTQERKPVVDKSFMDRMAEITGLTGAALVFYIIASEGSRLFPPRNLVPIP